MERVLPSAPEDMSLDGVPPSELGVVLSDYLNRLDSAFKKADNHTKIFGHYAALAAVMRAMSSLPGFDCELLILRDLTERLERLSVGQKMPIMALVDAVKVSGRPPESVSEGVWQARTVGVVEWLVSCGWQEKEALGLAVRCLTKAGVKGRRGPLSTRAVSEWPSKVKANDPIYLQAVQGLNSLCPEEVRQSRTMQRRVAEQLLRGSSITEACD